MTIRFAVNVAASFEQADPKTHAHATPVLELLSAGFEISWFMESSPGQWLALAKPDDAMKTHFGLARECYVIGAGPSVDFDQALLSQQPPADVIAKLDPELRLVACADPLAEAASAAWGAAKNIAVVVLKAGATPDSSPAEVVAQLYRALGTSLWRRDAFDEPEAVRSLTAFVGRAGVIAEVLAKVKSGSTVAILGVRKVGKSSLLGRLEDLLREDPACLTSIASLTGVSARLKNGRWWTVAQETLAAWQAGLAAIAAAAGSKVQVRVSQLQDLIAKKVVDPARLASAFEQDVLALVKGAQALAGALGRSAARLVLVLDESDQLYPTGDAGHWREDFFAFWDVVNTVRERIGRGDLVYVLAGANPAGCEQGSLCGKPNPLFAAHRVYLAPLNRHDAGALMSGVGSRMGLAFDESALDRAFELVGGHPFLLRRLGSALHHAEGERTGITTVTAETVTRAFRKHKREFYNQVTWMLDHFGRVAPDEERLLRDLALGGSLAYEESWSDDDLRETYAFTLERYGLVRFEGDTPVVALQLLKDALQKPATSGLDEQKRQLRELIDAVEKALRMRIAVDVSKDRSQVEAVHAIVNAIPSDAKNRPLARQGLIDVGEASGLAALLEAMNWGDYEILLSKFYEAIEWSGPPLAKAERLAGVKAMFTQAHLVRHNNDRELKDLIRTDGFAALYSRFCDVRDMLSA